MTAIVGNDGSFDFGTSPVHAGLMNRWRATWNYVTSEVTQFATTKNRMNRLGLPQITGSVSGMAIFDAASTAPAADLASGHTPGGEAGVTLQAATGCSWDGQAVFSTISLDVNKIGDTLLTFDFTSAGDDWAETWDEAP